jgi:hypothetical protein
MTFQEWWKANSYKYGQADYNTSDYEEIALAAWDAARYEFQVARSAVPEAPRITKAEAAQFLDDGFAIKVINAAPPDGRNQGRDYWRCPHCGMADFDGHEQSCVIRALVERLLGRHIPFGQLSVESPLRQKP